MKLTLCNFRKFIGEHVYIFEDQALNLLKGDSGMGKSTIFQAILWCLYAKIRNITDEKNKNTYVIIEIYDYYIKRSKPSDICEIHHDNKIYSGVEADSKIVQLFGTKDVFLSSSYILQNERHLLIQSSNAEKTDLLLELTFGSIDQPYDNSETYLTVISDEKIKVRQNIATLTGHYNALFQNYTSSYNSNKEKIEELIKINASKETLSHCYQNFKEKIREIEDLISQRKVYNNQIDKLSTEISSYESKITEDNSYLESLSIDTIKKELEDCEKLLDIYKIIQPYLSMLELPLKDLENKIDVIKKKINVYHKNLNICEKIGIRYSKIKVEQTLVSLHEDLLYNERLRKYEEDKTRAYNLHMKKIKKYQEDCDKFERNRQIHFQNQKIDQHLHLFKMYNVPYTEEDKLKFIQHLEKEIEKIRTYKQLYIEWQNNLSILRKKHNDKIKARNLKKEQYEKTLSWKKNVSEYSKLTDKIKELEQKIESLDLNQYNDYYKDVLNWWKIISSNRELNSFTLPIYKNQFDSCSECPVCKSVLYYREGKLELTQNYYENGFEQLKEYMEKCEIIKFEYNKIKKEIEHLRIKAQAINITEPEFIVEELITEEIEELILPNEPAKPESSEKDLLSLIETFKNIDTTIEKQNELDDAPNTRPFSIDFNFNYADFNYIKPKLSENEINEQIELLKEVVNFYDLDELTEKQNLILSVIEKKTLYDVFINSNLTYEKLILKKKDLSGKIKQYEIRLSEKEKNTILLEKLKTNMLELERKDLPSLNSLLEDKKTNLQYADYYFDLLNTYSLYEPIVATYNNMIQVQQNILKNTKYENNLSRMNKIFEELQAQAMNDTINTINTVVNSIITDLFNDDIEISLNTHKELKTKNILKLQLNVQLTYKGVTRDIKSLSGGEEDRVSFAFLIAFACICNSTPFLMLDECFSAINMDLREKCLKILKKYLPHKTIIVVSHEEVEGHYDNVVTVY